MHPGHIKHLKSARELADVLVVTVTPDRYVDKGPNRPVFSERLRAESIASLECVDFVAINEWPTAVETLRLIRPDYYAKGQEFENKDDATGKLQQEKEVLREIGGEMRYTHDIVYSSSNLLNDHFGIISDELAKLLALLKSKEYGRYVWQILEKTKRKKILVIGDAIIDDYHYCMPLNKSMKASCITSKYLEEEAGIGGSLCIANHLSDFCEDITLVSCFGSRDEYLEFTRDRLPEHVHFVPFLREGAFTTVKRRYVDKAFHQKIFEIHFFDDSPIEHPIENAVCRYLRENLNAFDLVIAADFGHGFMTQPIIEMICNESPYLALTVQTNSTNYGFNCVTKYPRADYVVLDEREVRLACQDRFSDLGGLVQQLSKRLSSRLFSVTLGREGAMIQDNGGFRKTPIVSTKMVDTIGSGDAFLALSAPAALLEAPPLVLLLLGSVAGAIAANTVGNSKAINKSDFTKFLRTLLK
jgi:cytidyltransferase-like protein